ncbi:MAG: Short-chain dehydrogenase [Marmoricola sp.]|nr:Short-chain dehydrogenase [Marmoricola sp.]
MARMSKGAVVTGSGQGLGKQIARLLSDRGFTVLATDVDLAKAQETAEEIGGFALAVDVRDHAQVQAAAAAIVERAGSLDVWVNNAGVLVTGPAWEQDEAQRRLMIEVNSIGVMNGTVAAINTMKDAGGGHIVNIASLAGLVAVPGEAVYAGSKHAVLGFSLSTAADLHLAKIRNIDISCICPDGIWTPMLHDKLEDPAAALSFSGKLLTAAEVVKAVGQVLDKPRQVTAVPRWRGVQVRALDALPDLALKALPLAVGMGRRTQKKLVRKGLQP